MKPREIMFIIIFKIDFIFRCLFISFPIKFNIFILTRSAFNIKLFIRLTINNGVVEMFFIMLGVFVFLLEGLDIEVFF
jgi:hypothetical protein